MTTFAAITTTLTYRSPSPSIRGYFSVEDGNGRAAEYIQPTEETQLGLVAQHREALRAFLGDTAEFIDIYVPGYLNSPRGEMRQIVWVRTK